MKIIVCGENDGTRPVRRTAPTRLPLIREAQRALRDLGYDPGPIDGVFGPRTRTALAKYQTSERLPVTSDLDALTLERLDVYRRLFRPTHQP